MPGGLLQLVALGAQDLYLSGNPQVTFFKVVYRRHTNFSMEHIRCDFTTFPKLSTTNCTKINLQIERKGDLIHDTYLVFDLPTIYTDRLSSFKWIKNIGERILNFVEVSLAGQRIDIEYGQWLNIWNELTLDFNKRKSYDKLIGNEPILRPEIFHTQDGAIIPKTRLYIPFNFWFCQNPGLALPLIALQYTPLIFTLEFNPLNDLFTIGQNPALAPEEFFNSFIGDCQETPIVHSEENKELYKLLISEGWTGRTVLYRYINAGDINADCTWKSDTFLEINYIFLDTNERRRFAQVSHEYLITQTNRRIFTGLVAGTNIFELKLNHPTKNMVWVFQREDVYQRNDWFNYTIVKNLDEYLELLKFSNSNSYLDAVSYLAQDTLLGDTNTENLFQNISLQGKSIDNNAFSEDFLNIMISAKLIFNGNDRIDEKDYKYFNALHSFKFHTNLAAPGVQLYSFGLDPENMHPSGSANLSALNRFELFTKLKQAVQSDIEYDMFLYTRNFNILRIMGGIGQLAYYNS
jgi:hypothetical protein